MNSSKRRERAKRKALSNRLSRKGIPTPQGSGDAGKGRNLAVGEFFRNLTNSVR